MMAEGQTTKDYDSKVETILKCLYRREDAGSKPGIVQKEKEKVSKLVAEGKLNLKEEWKPQNVLINDAIHGPVELNSLLVKIIDTPEFQRLRHIKQLGGGSYVYPGATHQRFDHSIGVCHIAGEFGRFLKNQLDEINVKRKENNIMPWSESIDITKEEILCLQIAGLCHDLGHGPFSHTFEQRVKLGDVQLPQHEILSLMVFEQIMKAPSVLAEFVYVYDLELCDFHLIKDMIHPKRERVADADDISLKGRKKKEFLLEVVANKESGIDVDKWDYFTRDCHYLGIAMDFQWKRCMLLGRICKDTSKDNFHITFNIKELDNIYGMGRTRSTLHRKAYVHKTKVAVEEMFAAAIRKVADVPLISKWNPYNMEDTDTSPIPLKQAIKNVATKQDIRWFLPLTDYSIITLVRNWKASSKEDDEHKKSIGKAVEILNRIDQRQLYHLVLKEPFPKMNTKDPPGDSQDEDKIKIQRWNVSKLMKKNKEDKSAEAARLDKLKNLGKEIFGKEIFEKDAVFVEVVSISFGSESKDDPVEKVLFYTAENPFEANVKDSLKRDKTLKASSLTLPENFTEYEIRVYNTLLPNDPTFDETQIKKKFDEWKDKRLSQKAFF